MWWGYSTHTSRERDSLSAGASIKGIMFEETGFVCSLMNNLIASANGTGRPIKAGLLGPFRV